MTFKRRVLLALGKEELLTIGRGLALDVKARMSVDELRDTLGKSKRATPAAFVNESLSRDTLKAICAALDLSETGTAKSVLIERILEQEAHGTKAPHHGEAKSAYNVNVADGSTVRDDVQGWLIDRLPAHPPSKAAKAKAAKAKAAQLTGTATVTANADQASTSSAVAASAVAAGAPATVKAGAPAHSTGKAQPAAKKRRRGATANPANSADSEAFVSGSLKAALRQFALAAAGGYTGRDAAQQWTTHLLECFGWPEGRPPEAELGRRVAIADAGIRVTHDVALWWPARRTMLEVVAHDAVLDFAWKDVLRVCL